MQLIAAPRQLHQLVTQIMVIVRRAVDGLRDALAVGIVAIGDIRPGLAHPRQLTPVLPCVRPRAHLLAFYGVRITEIQNILLQKCALVFDGSHGRLLPACSAAVCVDGPEHLD